MEINKIYNEDCLDTMGRMPDDFLDLTVTSPPYDNLRTYKNNIDKTWGEHVWKPIIRELYRVTKQGGVVVWVVGDATIKGSETGTSFRQALWAMDCGFNLHDTMIYFRHSPPTYHNRYEQAFEYMFVFAKKGKVCCNHIMRERRRGSRGCTNPNFGKRQKGDTVDFGFRKDTPLVRKENVWKYSVGNGGSTTDKIAFKHPAIFPEKLANDHIISWSNEGNLVYDPFMGSGTTAKMAMLNKRNYIGSELSHEYCEIIKQRLSEAKRKQSEQLF